MNQNNCQVATTLKQKSYQTIHSYGQLNPEGPENLLYDILKEVEGGMHIEVLAAGELI